MNPETGEPTDELLPQAKQAIAALGSKCTTVTAIVDDKDSAVMEAIQKGLDKVNSNSHSDVHKVYGGCTHTHTPHTMDCLRLRSLPSYTKTSLYREVN